MAKYKLTPDELETTINYSKADENASIMTYDKKIIRYLRKYGAAELIINKDFNFECVEFVVPISWIKIVKPRTRTMTDEDRQAASDRLKLARESVLRS